MIDYLNKETYNFYLPEELIATNPNYKRDKCKLMTMNIKTGEIEHKIFYDIIDYLKKDDILISWAISSCEISYASCGHIHLPDHIGQSYSYQSISIDQFDIFADSILKNSQTCSCLKSCDNRHRKKRCRKREKDRRKLQCGVQSIVFWCM